MSGYFIFLTVFLFGSVFSEGAENLSAVSESTAQEELLLEQGENPPEQGSSFNQEIEKLKITGSRISRIDFEGPSPVTILTKEELDDRGYFNVGDYFNNTSLSNFGAVSVNNRSTLTLINGARLVFGEAGNFVNGIPKRLVDVIPNSAIERVEILRDGSSALYGSDVVGGVINIITKKDLTAPEISLKLAPTLYPLYKGGSRAEASAVLGKKFSKWSFLSAWQFQYGNGLKQMDRKKWYASSPLFFRVKGLSTSEIKCPAGGKKTEDGCQYDQQLYNYIFANIYDLSSYNYFEYEFSRDISFYSQLLGLWHYSTIPDQYFYGHLNIPAGHKMSVGAGSAMTLENLFLTGSDVLNRSFFLDGQAGLKGYLSKTWDFDLNVKWSSVLDSSTETNYPYKEDFIKAILSGAYDPFDSSEKGLSDIKKHDVVSKNFDTKLFGTLDLSGETGFWGINMSVGLQAHYINYTHTFDPLVEQDKILFSLPAGITSGEKTNRAIFAGYIEGIKNFSDLLEIQLAGRIDHYSDFGWTFNPKLSARFQPSSQFIFRSSLGTSFEAPSLSYLHTPHTTGDVWIYDTVACYNQLNAGAHFKPIYDSLTGEKFTSQESKDKLIKEFLIEQSAVVEDKSLSDGVKSAFKGLAGQMAQSNYCNQRQRVSGTYKGNKNLKPVKALVASSGFHWDITEDHGLTVDAWFNSLSGVILPSFASQKTVDAELRYGKKYVEDEGVQYERDSAEPHPITNPVASFLNLSGKKLYGVNLSWTSYFLNWKFREGHFYFADDFSYMIKAGVENFKGMGFVNNLGKFILPKWRNFASVGWKSAKHDISLVLKSAAGVKKQFDESERLPMINILDLFYKYNMDPKTTLRFGWYNLLFSDPVLDDSVQRGIKFNDSFFDPRGPRFFVEVRRLL